jgi:hypothetical protein
MLLALIPVLSAVTSQATAFDSEPELERAVSVGVRTAIAAGWTLVDAGQIEDGFTFTLTRGGVTERHVASFDGGIFYRVEPAELPEHPRAPSAELIEALRGRGGVELEASCGVYYDRPYLVEGYAAGAEARELVARTLAGAADLEGASVDGARAVFALQLRGRVIDLVVTLTEDGDVSEAELRRFSSREDESTYRRRGAMVRALRRAFVTSIRDGVTGVVLHTSRGRFAIDPDGDAFRAKHTSDREDGCGC